MTLRVICIVIATMFAIFVDGVTVAQTTAPSTPQTPGEAFRDALVRLKREGESARETGRSSRARANFAADFPAAVPLDLVAEQLLSPMHRDPFVDAYMRWQLTSFNPTLPRLRERDFDRMAQSLPRFVENPRADSAILKLLQRAVDQGELNEKDEQRVDEALEELSKNVSAANSLNEAPRALREWFLRQYQDDPGRSLLLRLEHVVSLAQAGWPTERMKSQLQAAIEQSARSRDFTDDQRKRFLKRLENAAGIERMYVGSARLVEKRVTVQYFNTAIYDFDVRRWAGLLKR